MARSFNSGALDHILATAVDVSTFSALSFSAWFNINTIAFGGDGYAAVVVQNLGSQGIFIRSTGVAAYYVQTNTATTSRDPGALAVSGGQWFHIALVSDLSSLTAQGYLNGVPDGAGFALGASSANYIARSNFGIGYTPSPDTEYFPGVLADIAVWNARLSPADVMALATATARPSQIQRSALQAFWPLDGTVAFEFDESGNGNLGDVTGTTLAAGPPFAPFALMGSTRAILA